MYKLYIDKGNEKQIIDVMNRRGVPGISFEGRQDHLGWRTVNGLS